MTTPDRLLELLAKSPSGEEIAAIICDLLADEQKELVLVAKLAEALKEVSSLEAPPELSPVEREAADLVLDAGLLLMAHEVAERAKGDSKSLKHRSAASAILNELATKGVLGKVERGREVCYASPREAVVQALIGRGELPTECSPDEISKATGMPLVTVLTVLRTLVEA